MTDHFKRQEHNDQRKEIEMYCLDRKQNYFSMEVDEPILACTHNKDDNKPNKDSNNYCGDIMWKSKHLAICALSCSAVQLGRHDKTMDLCGRSLC